MRLIEWRFKIVWILRNSFIIPFLVLNYLEWRLLFFKNLLKPFIDIVTQFVVHWQRSKRDHSSASVLILAHFWVRPRPLAEDLRPVRWLQALKKLRDCFFGILGGRLGILTLILLQAVSFFKGLKSFLKVKRLQILVSLFLVSFWNVWSCLGSRRLAFGFINGFDRWKLAVHLIFDVQKRALGGAWSTVWLYFFVVLVVLPLFNFGCEFVNFIWKRALFIIKGPKPFLIRETIQNSIHSESLVRICAVDRGHLWEGPCFVFCSKVFRHGWMIEFIEPVLQPERVLFLHFGFLLIVLKYWTCVFT